MFWEDEEEVSPPIFRDEAWALVWIEEGLVSEWKVCIKIQDTGLVVIPLGQIFQCHCADIPVAWDDNLVPMRWLPQLKVGLIRWYIGKVSLFLKWDTGWLKVYDEEWRRLGILEYNFKVRK